MPLFQYKMGSTDIEDRVARLEDGYRSIQGIVSGWMGTGTEPNFRSFTADFGHFLQPPLEVIAVAKFGGSQSIPNADLTILSWDTPYFDWGDSFLFSTATGESTRILLRRVGDRAAYLTFGVVDFAANSSGFREVRVSTGSTSGAWVAASAAAVSGGGTSVPFAFPIARGTASTAIGLTVWQNSGANLNVAAARFGILKIGLTP